MRVDKEKRARRAASFWLSTSALVVVVFAAAWSYRGAVADEPASPISPRQNPSFRVAQIPEFDTGEPESRTQSQGVPDLVLKSGGSGSREGDEEDDPFGAGPSPRPESRTETEEGEGPRTFHVPLANSPGNRVAVQRHDGMISLIVRDASLNDVLTRLAETHGFNIVMAETLDAKLTITLNRVTLEDAMDAVLSVAGYTWVRKNNIVFVTSLSAATKVAPEMQDRKLKVFQLDYASATDLQQVVTGMLSPVGNVYVLNASDTDNRKTREVIVVEDLPHYLNDVRQFIMQMDVPPRQVLIEAYVLQVDLGDDNKHGVNFQHLFDLSGSGITLETKGLANASSSQAFFVNLSGGQLTALLECLKTTTDAKTLASPRIVVMNGQTARIQVGEQLGFRVTTTTETMTTESVEFLDVGVMLEVTPRISQSDMVTMRIRPEVSTGEVNPSTGLPEEQTTELETDVALKSGRGLVIGGLIQEVDSDQQSKIPVLGDLWLVGKLFQRHEATKSRREIVIAMVPHVIPYDPCYQEQAEMDLTQATTPLVYGPLERYPRPWEPSLPNAYGKPHLWRLPPLDQGCLFRPYEADPQGGFPTSGECASPAGGRSPTPAGMALDPIAEPPYVDSAAARRGAPGRTASRSGSLSFDAQRLPVVAPQMRQYGAAPARTMLR
ncbi:MAG: hypothetical protein ACC645_04640 [Pirellulales bacterium]